MRRHLKDVNRLHPEHPRPDPNHVCPEPGRHPHAKQRPRQPSSSSPARRDAATRSAAPPKACAVQDAAITAADRSGEPAGARATASESAAHRALPATSKARTFEPSRNLLGLGSHPFVTQAPLGSDNPSTRATSPSLQRLPHVARRKPPRRSEDVTGAYSFCNKAHRTMKADVRIDRAKEKSRTRWSVWTPTRRRRRRR